MCVQNNEYSSVLYFSKGMLFIIIIVIKIHVNFDSDIHTMNSRANSKSSPTLNSKSSLMSNLTSNLPFNSALKSTSNSTSNLNLDKLVVRLFMVLDPGLAINDQREPRCASAALRWSIKTKKLFPKLKADCTQANIVL